MMRFALIALTLAIAGCCSCGEIEPTPSEVSRAGDAAAIRSSLAPLIQLESAAFISSVVWIESTEIVPAADFKTNIELQAAYARHDVVIYRPGTDAYSLAHEVMHAFWEHNLVPDKANFVRSLDTVLAGTSGEEEHVRMVVTELAADVRRNYPDRSYDTEMYAYIGGLVICEHDFPIPEIILRHYRGVVRSEILARRDYNNFKESK